MVKITETEYFLMKRYIEESCGIHLEEGKEYLIETRLRSLVNEAGCRTFHEFYIKAQNESSKNLRDLIVDAMTTNETSWFRDTKIWHYLASETVPGLIDKACRREKLRIWSAAVSTGQEVYSFLMLLHEEALKRDALFCLPYIEILASDISWSALEKARNGRYDQMEMSRGLPADKRMKYFDLIKREWCIKDILKERVLFKQFNLQNCFQRFGYFDLIFCRYVSIYFASVMKKDLFSRMARILLPEGELIIGATETVRNLSSELVASYADSAAINRKKNAAYSKKY
jgi:chemotaxis protein methyltransferase CheR